jgi:hypothetical protein
MKCLENKVSSNLLHEILEDAGEWINVRDGDAYLSCYFSHIGADDLNVSVYGISFKEAVSNYVYCNCYEKDDGSIFAHQDEEQDLKTFINVFEKQLQRLKSIKIEGAE